MYHTPGSGLAFHWDKDEAQLVETGVMRHPLLSSVLYLNDAEECGPPRLGVTMVTDQTFDAETGEGTPDPCRRTVLAWPTSGALLVFDGALAHGVLDSRSSVVRRTILVNWWSAAPTGVRRLTAAEYAGDHALSQPLSLDDDGAPSAERASVPLFELLAASDCGDGPQLLDEVLRARGFDPDQASAVALHYPDSLIWQVEPDQGEEDAKQVAVLVADRDAACEE